jgi:hypothetical protein
MKRSFSILALLAVPSLVGCAASAGDTPSPEETGKSAEALDVIHFPILPLFEIDVVNDATKASAFKKDGIAYGNSAYGQSELGATLAANQLGAEKSHVELRDDVAAQELLVYARDPAEHAATIDHLMSNAYANGTLPVYSGLWQVEQQQWDGQSHATALPSVLSLANPNNRCLGPPCTSTISSYDLSTVPWGYKGWPSTAVPGLAAPNGSGSVKAFAMYDHGTCSHEIPLSDLMGGKLDSIWNDVKTQVAGEWDVDYGDRQFQGASAFVSHTPGSLTDIHGGVILASQFFLKTYLGHDISIAFSSKYQFTLDAGGIISAIPNVWLSVAGNDGVYQDLSSKLVNDGPAQIHAAAAARQVAPVPASDLPIAKLKLVIGISQAKTALNLTEADAEALQTLVEDSSNWTNVDGAGKCLPSGAQTACQFIVRAKRLNVYPDAIEPVFVDGKDIKSPTYALYAALVGADASQHTSLTKELCTQSGPASGGTEYTDWRKRGYYVETRGYERFDP